MASRSSWPTTFPGIAFDTGLSTDPSWTSWSISKLCGPVTTKWLYSTKSRIQPRLWNTCCSSTSCTWSWTWGYGIIFSPHSTYLDFTPVSWTSSWPFSTTTIWTRNSSSFFSETYSDYTIKSIELRNALHSWKNTNGQNPKPTFGQHWKPDEEHYDTQKLNGLILPRTIRASSWSQLKDIEGCDPLTVPLSKLLYQGSENFWLRKLAAGREVYVATMGEVSQVVFVSEILSQLRTRGIDLDKLAQRKALQDGHALEKREAIQSLAKQIGDQLQRWSPSIQADTSSQHKIAELEARLAALQAAANQSQAPAAGNHQAEAPAPAPEGQPAPSRVQSPLAAAFQGQRPAAFDPAQLLVSPGSNNPWLESNMIESFSDSKYKTWFKNLKLDNATRQTVERNIVAVDNWWENQPEDAELRYPSSQDQVWAK